MCDLGEDIGESVSSLDGCRDRMHRLFVGGGSTSISSTFARCKLTTTTLSPTLMATERGDLPFKKSSI